MKTTACIKLLALLLLAACDRTSKLSFEGGAPGGVHTIADLKARCTANSVACTHTAARGPSGCSSPCTAPRNTNSSASGAAAQCSAKLCPAALNGRAAQTAASTRPVGRYASAQPKAASRAAVRFCGLCMALPPFCLAYLITAAVERASILRSAAPNVAQPIDFARRVLV